MLNELWDRYRGQCIGVVAGFFFGVLYLLVGFLDMLVFMALMAAGFYVGRKVDRGEPILWRSPLSDWLSERRKRSGRQL